MLVPRNCWYFQRYKGGGKFPNLKFILKLPFRYKGKMKTFQAYKASEVLSHRELLRNILERRTINFGVHQKNGK